MQMVIFPTTSLILLYVYVDEEGFNQYRPATFRELVGSFIEYK